jgi:hypothetical protein
VPAIHAKSGGADSEIFCHVDGGSHDRNRTVVVLAPVLLTVPRGTIGSAASTGDPSGPQSIERQRKTSGRGSPVQAGPHPKILMPCFSRIIGTLARPWPASKIKNQECKKGLQAGACNPFFLPLSAARGGLEPRSQRRSILSFPYRPCYRVRRSFFTTQKISCPRLTRQ